MASAKMADEITSGQNMASKTPAKRHHMQPHRSRGLGRSASSHGSVTVHLRAGLLQPVCCGR